MMLCLILINDVLINVTNFGSCQEGFFFLYLAKLRKLLLKYIERQENGAVMWSKKD